MSNRSKWLVAALCGWTFFVWGTRISNAWSSTTESTSAKVSGTGQAHKKGSNGQLILLRNDEVDADASMVWMKPAYGTYGTAYKSFTSLGFGRTVRWIAGTLEGHQYDVKKFKVSWTYYVLVK